MTLRAVLLLPLFLVAACSGYRLGASKPTPLAHVSVIQVEMVRNETQWPRAAAYATNAIADALARDGTYRLGSAGSADARLSTTLRTIRYQQVRSSPIDTLTSEELEMTAEFRWILCDASNPTRILDQGTTVGRSRFFVDPNLATARQTAISDAMKRAAESLVARLANGF
jgi:hypothetical protein